MKSEHVKTIYSMLLPLTDNPEEVIRFRCTHAPCYDDGLVLTSDKLHSHAINTHNSYTIILDRRVPPKVA